MKASEVLNRYDRGERDFRGANLRGQSFKGQDLSKADFSGADIRGTNFSNAILKEANFTEAKAGIQKRWWGAQHTLAFLISAVSGFLSAILGTVIALLFVDNSPDKTVYFITGVITLGLIAVVVSAISRQGFTAKAFSTIVGAGAVAVAVAVVVAVAVPLAGSGSGSGSVALAFTLATAFAVVGAGIVAFASYSSCALAFALAGAGAYAGSFASYSESAFADVRAVALAGALAVAGTSLLLAIYCSRRAFKSDEKFALLRAFGVAFGAFSGTSFCGSDLTNANFSHANLKRANFNHTKERQTTLYRVNWQGAKCLDRARFGNSILAEAAVRELLVTLEGSHKSYIWTNLEGVNLNGVNLEGADLTKADLSCATLRHANLKDANLPESLVLNTDFTEATLTGACLEAWNIDSNTILDKVNCQYVYLLRNQQDRRPSSGDFAPGDFTKLFQEVFNTVDLIFRNGVDWQAFAYTFRQVQIENEADELAIASIENKGDGVVVIRIKATAEADRPKLYGDFMQVYEVVHKALEAQYQERLEDKDKHINQLFALVHDYQAQDAQVKKLMAEAPKFNFNAPVGNVADTVQAGGKQQNIQHIYASEHEQTLAEAAAEIQALLQQLEQTNPTATESDQKAFVNAAISPTKRERVLGAVQAGGLAVLEETQYGKIIKAIIEGWRKPGE